MSDARTSPTAPLDWRQAAFITAAALAVFVLVRQLPVGSDLNHMDFRVAEKGAIEFCDPSSPQFIPVVAVKSPVSLGLRAATQWTAGQANEVTLTLTTSAGKPIGPGDLLVAHTRKLHLLVVDPTLQDYQHLHPEPGPVAGEWVFRVTPRLSGQYRVFADFMPAATGRGLYASTDFVVPGVPAALLDDTGLSHVADDLRFSLEHTYLKAGKPAELKFRVETTEAGGRVVLEPVMGAFAHLVMFDVVRSGFAHLHPVEADLTKVPDAVRPELTFKVTVPRPGRFIVWAQVQRGGRDRFAPFALTVNP